MADDEVVIKFTQQDAEGVSAAIAGVQEQLTKLASAFGNLAVAQGAATEGAQELGKESSALGDKMNNTATVTGSLLDQVFALRNAFRMANQPGMQLGGLLSTLQRLSTAAASGLGSAVLGAGALAGAFTALIVKASQVTQATYEQAKSLSVLSGMSVEAADNLTNAFRLAGASTSSLSMAFFRMSSEIDEGGKNLGKFGITLRDLAGNLKTEGDLFLEVRDRLAGLGSAAARNAAAVELFGRAGRGMIDILSISREKFKELQAEAEKNRGMTTELAGKTREYQQAVEKLSQQWEGLWLTIGPKAIEIAKKQVDLISAFVLQLKAVAEFIEKYGGGGPEAGSEADRRAQAIAGILKDREEAAARIKQAEQDADVAGKRRLAEMNRVTRESYSQMYEWITGKIREIGEANDAIVAGGGLLRGGRPIAEAEIKTRMQADAEMRREIARGESLQARSRQMETIGDADRRMAEFRVKSRAEMADKIVQIEAAMAADVSKLLTDREAPAVKIQIEALERRLAIERELQKELERRRAIQREQESRGEAVDKPGQEALEREAVANAQKQLQMQAELGNLRRKQLEAENADYRKAMEQRLGDARAFAEREQSMLTYHRDQWMAYLEASTRKQLDLVRSQASLEQTYTRQTAEARTSSIDKQIEEQRKYGDQFRQIAAVQVQVAETIRGLQQDRLSVEQDTNRKIYESRKKLAEQERQIALETAALGGDIEASARLSLEKRGIKSYSQTQLAQEYQNLLRQTAQYAENFSQGFALTGEQIDLTRTISRQRMTMANQGVAPNEALSRSWDVMRRPELYAGPINVGGIEGVNAPEFERVAKTVEETGITMGSFQKSVDMASTMVDGFTTALTNAVSQISNSLSQLPSVLSGGVRGEGYTSITFPKATGGQEGPFSGKTVGGSALQGGRSGLGFDVPDKIIFHTDKGDVEGSLPKYQQGAWSVPRTGPAILHADEMVVPSQMADRMRDLLSGREAAMSSVMNRRLGGDGLGESYAGAFGIAEREMIGFEDRMRARLRSLNTSVRDHLINVIKTELPVILQQQGARR